MKKRILITGGCGFIGHHFCEHILKNSDWDIVILDKLNYASNGFDRLRVPDAEIVILPDIEEIVQKSWVGN